MEKEQLEKEGWKFSAESTEARLTELVQEYKGRGLEVCLEKIAPAVGSEEIGCGSHCGVSCTVCWDGPEGPSYRVYVKQKN